MNHVPLDLLDEPDQYEDVASVEQHLVLCDDGRYRPPSPLDGELPDVCRSEALQRTPAGRWLLVERWLDTHDLVSGLGPCISSALLLSTEEANLWCQARGKSICPLAVNPDTGVVLVNGRRLRNALGHESALVLAYLVKRHPEPVQPEELNRKLGGDPCSLLRYLRSAYPELALVIQPPGKGRRLLGWRLGRPS